MNRFFQTISQYIFFQHHTYVSELYFFKGDSSLQCTTVALRRKISANICLLSFLAWSMVARKQKWNLKKKKNLTKTTKENGIGWGAISSFAFYCCCWVSRQNVYSEKKTQTKRQNPPTNNNIGLEIAQKVGM